MTQVGTCSNEVGSLRTVHWLLDLSLVNVSGLSHQHIQAQVHPADLVLHLFLMPQTLWRVTQPCTQAVYNTDLGMG